MELTTVLIITNRSQEVIAAPVKDLSTTGSMEAASYFLDCADASEFEIGDHIIVEIGGEAGGGLRNTDGVGGLQTMSFTSPDWGDINWYYHYPMPRSLLATIVGKVGDVLELDTPAYVATTNANVYFDNSYLWWSELTIFNNPSLLSNKTVQFPAGKFAFSKAPGTGTSENANMLGYRRRSFSLDKSIQAGETRIYSPKGLNCIGFGLNGVTAGDSHDARIARITVEQHVLRDGGYLFGESPVGRWGYGFLMSHYDNPFMIDCLLIDWGVESMAFSDCENARGFRCNMLRTEPHMTYLQWGLGCQHSYDTRWYDCRVDSPQGLQSAFENFRSESPKYIRCGGINAALSSGGSNGFLYDEFWSTITEDSGTFGRRDWGGQIVMFIGDNVGSWLDKSVGGEIRNPRIIQEGYVDPDNGLLKSIVIYAGARGSTDYANISITGTDYTKAYIEAPDYVDSGWGGAQIQTDAHNTEVRGIRLVGDPKQYGNISVSGNNSVVEDCVADEIEVSGTGSTQSGNQTNAEYEA